MYVTYDRNVIKPGIEQLAQAQNELSAALETLITVGLVQAVSVDETVQYRLADAFIRLGCGASREDSGNRNFPIEPLNAPSPDR